MTPKRRTDLIEFEIRAQGRHKSAKVLPRYAKRTMKQIADPPLSDQEEDDMRKMTRHVLGAAGLALIVTTSVVWAQEAQSVRVRGEIAKVEGNALLIKSRDGQNLTVKLADNAR